MIEKSHTVASPRKQVKKIARTNRETILEQVKSIVYSQLKPDSSTKIFLFGSWARNEEKRTSDIDVAIQFGHDETSQNLLLMNIRNALDESTIPYRVDVVHLNKADSYIQEKVNSEGILWDD